MGRVAIRFPRRDRQAGSSAELSRDAAGVLEEREASAPLDEDPVWWTYVFSAI
jgi:hypothetical protein